MGFMRFQSAPPHGGRQAIDANNFTLRLFQSAPPHGGRLRIRCIWTQTSSFNPRPRTGGDPRFGFALPDHPVSIRAPARGATAVTRKAAKLKMFQSAPPHGGRQNPARLQSPAVQVVSIRAPARGATSCEFAVTYSSRQAPVSIRAPARGATSLVSTLATVSALQSFNPRPRTGGDVRRCS